MLLLPALPRKAWLRAFWITIGVWLALIAGLSLPLGPLARSVAAALVGAVVAVAGIACPRQAAAVYRVWHRVSRFHALGTRRVLLALCYFVIFAVVGRAGSALRLRRPSDGESLWEPRETQPTSSYHSQSRIPGPAWVGRRWTAVTVWAFRSRRPWVVFLLPLLMVVSMLELEEQEAFPTGIYTLF